MFFIGIWSKYSLSGEIVTAKLGSLLVLKNDWCPYNLVEICKDCRREERKRNSLFRKPERLCSVSSTPGYFANLAFTVTLLAENNTYLFYSKARDFPVNKVFVLVGWRYF